LYACFGVCRISSEIVRRSPILLVCQCFGIGRASAFVYCAVLTYLSVYQSGMSDLFVAFSVFIGPAMLFSAISMGMKMQLLLRRVAERRRMNAGNQRATKRNFLQLGMKVALRMLAEEYVLRYDQLQHQELKSSNDVLLHQGFSCAIGAACEDLPFCILNTGMCPPRRFAAYSRCDHCRVSQCSCYALSTSATRTPSASKGCASQTTASTSLRFALWFR
jgi:hypothetical protein